MAASRLDWYRGKNIHVLGPAGTEGSAVLDFLLRRGVTTLTAHEMAPREAFEAEFDRTHQWLPLERRREAAQRLLAAPVTVRWAGDYLQGIEQAEVIFVPQSWFRHPRNAPVRERRDRGVPLSSMTHLFFEESPCPITGVTGTNGKFTVAHLIHQMLARSGLRAFFSGNDRSHVPMLYYVEEIRPDDHLVLEISNRQLVGLPYSPHIGVITNIAAHHLDDHGSMEAYVEVKYNLIRHQGPDDMAILNADNVHTAILAARLPAPYMFSGSRKVIPGAYVEGDSVVISRGGTSRRVLQSFPLSVLRQPGRHAVENALAASLAASLAGASAPAMAETLAEFRGLPYRFRLVEEVAGVRYYEDSLATNPDAAAAAIAAMDRPFVLIAGGARPNASPEQFAPMREALAAAPVRAVQLIGATTPQLAAALKGLDVPVAEAGTLERALEAAAAAARPGDAVLLSPGCESFDQFRDYRERGDRFAALVRQELRRA